MTDVPELPDLTPVPRVRNRDQVSAFARSGQAAMSVGLVVFGAASYVFLAASGRALGPSRFGLISVMWGVLFLIGGGLFVPLEQELGRSIAARRARGLGFGALLRRVAAVGAVLFVAVSALIALCRDQIAEQLFRGDHQFVAALALGILGIGVMFFVRGLLAGSDRYFGFAALFLADAATKSAPTVVLAVAGVTSPLAYALVLAVSSFAGAVVPLVRGVRPGPAGPTPEWSPLLSSLGFLLLTSFLSALTVNISIIAVEVLATPAETEKAGVFLSGLVIARIPLFMFQAVQAIVLPKLSSLAAAGEMVAFRRLVQRLGIGMAAATVAATAVSAVLGPAVVRLLFGDEFGLLGVADMALLSLGSMLIACAMTVNQAQIALHQQRQTGWPWGVGTIAFVVVAALTGPDLFLRVELALVAGAAVLTVISSALLASELRHPDHLRAETPWL